MRFAYPLILAIMIPGVIAGSGCSKESLQQAAEEQKSPAGTLAAKQKLQEISTRMEELSFEIKAMNEKLAGLDKAREKVDELEQKLALTRSALNELEKRPIPAPRKPTPAPEQKPEKKSPERIAVSEPVPTGSGEDAAGKEPAEKEQKSGDGEDSQEDGAEGEGDEEASEDDTEGDGDKELVEVPPGQLGVVNLKFATDVNRDTRMPITPGTSFDAGEKRLYCWLVLSNKGDKESTVTLHWKHEDKVVSDIELSVGRKTNHWRTWAYIRPHPAGTWEAEIRDPAGNTIGSGKFTIQ